ncbi:hypothetical protein ACP70R_033460 [Stipagrostis hirtigluma subsp. patula]
MGLALSRTVVGLKRCTAPEAKLSAFGEGEAQPFATPMATAPAPAPAKRNKPAATPLGTVAKRRERPTLKGRSMAVAAAVMLGLIEVDNPAEINALR